MTDWSDPLDDPMPGTASRAFVALACAIVWLICAPFQIYARLCERANRNPLGEDADPHGAAEGGQNFHNGGNV